jgi:hypothetical protein
VNMAAARDAALDEVVAVVSESRALPQATPEEAVAFGLDLARLPKHAALEAARQWDEGQGLTQALTRRVGLAPLVACLALLLAANFLVARGVRGTPRPLPGG